MNDEVDEKALEVIHEHTESLKLLLSITSQMEKDIIALRTRLTQAEAKLAYYAQEVERGNGLIQ